MINLIVPSQSFSNDAASKTVWGWLSGALQNTEGVAYYQHPIIRSAGAPPDLLVLARGYNPVAVKCLPYQIDDLTVVTSEVWGIGAGSIDSPFLQAEDFSEALNSKFKAQRALRHLLKTQAAVAFPNISRREFETKFGPIGAGQSVVWQDGDLSSALTQTPELTEEQWKLCMSVFQSVTPLMQKGIPAPLVEEPPTKLGAAIKALNREISLLDLEQQKVAVQVPEGPQRIRGLAGTGKTVLLAMKAANIHMRYPEKKILFTFSTHSLYRQAQRLIQEFYEVNGESGPNWDRLHIRHAWGGRSRPGVYSELAQRQNRPPLDFNAARRMNGESPFAACLQSALQMPIEPEYDFILIDEAQDFPAEFFRVAYQLSHPPHSVYWAYDELQNLTALEMPKLEELFGSHPDGSPVVSLEGEYPGGIEKDLVLQKSYRCPRSVLMLAHAIGLGLYAPRGCVQMLGSTESWKAVGYELESGELVPGNNVVIARPDENSPNPIERIYKGSQDLITAKKFDDRTSELGWVAESIEKDIKEEGVPSEQIVVITLNSIEAKRDLARLQQFLFARGINSLIPGIVHDAASFAEPGYVTLATVHRAKGNEAPVVYVINAEHIATYQGEIEARNRFFTSVSRAKGWVRVTGSGTRMDAVLAEIHKLVNDIPRFRFAFPDPRKIRQLDLETSRRRAHVTRVKRSVKELLDVDADALSQTDPEALRELYRKLGEAMDEPK
ncbi:hypothetical protein COCOR_03372 [Corallococcus coralloides DSM 2259]|uniref:DNA 3'-5' helicase II n=1 Tax=Corallococcus coralloides (strain ATCC 25202 / DSM 2259 / NBRC 100086 / M2) TaxID=1144275 RepID=H8MJ57_CORCM|nr:ATP-binding domain-containing protein [Corallococcus coralloides]AFE05186.1 hypothetical protein COCOR_03372 [Corallococcus coralloides DSM 2259]